MAQGSGHASAAEGPQSRLCFSFLSQAERCFSPLSPTATPFPPLPASGSRGRGPAGWRREPASAGPGLLGADGARAAGEAWRWTLTRAPGARALERGPGCFRTPVPRPAHSLSAGRGKGSQTIAWRCPTRPVSHPDLSAPVNGEATSQKGDSTEDKEQEEGQNSEGGPGGGSSEDLLHNE